METGKGQTGETVKPGNSAERRKGSENDLDPEPAQEDAATVEGQPPEIALSKDQLELATDDEKMRERRKGSLEGGAVFSGPGKYGEYKYKEKYREQRKRDAIAREKLLKRQKFHRAIALVLSIVIAAEVVIAVTLLVFILIVYGIKSSTIAEPWQFRNLPITHNFRDFAVASNSETCNEEARTLYLEGHSIYGIAFAMLICLSKKAPHRSGLGGASVALMVDAKENSCLQTSGYPRKPEWWDQYISAPAYYPKQFQLSIALPGESKTLKAFESKMDPAERDLLLRKLFRPESSRFAVGADYAREIRHLNTVLNLYGNRYSFLSDHKGLPHQESDLNMAAHRFTNYSEWNSAYTKLSEYFPELGPVFGHTDEQQGDYVLKGEVGSIGDELFCMPRKPRSSTFILEALSELNETVRRETANTGDPEQDLFFLAYRTVARVTDIAMEESLIERIPHHVEYTLYDFRGEIARRTQAPQASFGGNFFTLVDAKKQQAIACTSTLGNSFGSLINSYRDLTIILNNLFDYASALEDKVGQLNTFVFIPMISFKNGTDAKIRFTWACPGGSLERSLDIPRLITSVIFKIFGGTTLLNATTTPLLFPVGSSRNIHTGGVPYTVLMKLFNMVNDYWLEKAKQKAGPVFGLGGVGTRYRFLDSTSGVEVDENGGLNPFFFTNDGDRAVPSGV